MQQLTDKEPSTADLVGHVRDFLYEEAAALDELRYADWLEMLDEDFYYCVPVPLNREDPLDVRYSERGVLFDANRRFLALKTERLTNKFAWSDRPTGFTRRFVTNTRIVAREDTIVTVMSNVLVARTTPSASTTVTAGRRDSLRVRYEDGAVQLKVVRRDVYLDSTLPSHQQLNVIF